MQQCEFCSNGKPILKHILYMNPDEAIKHMNIRLAAHTNYGAKSYIEHDLQKIIRVFNEQGILLDMQKGGKTI